MHGLVLWAIAFMFEGNIELAVVAMVAAVNFKQMALYFALPFGVYALVEVVKQAQKSSSNIVWTLILMIGRILCLLTIFILINGLLWGPIAGFSLDGAMDIVYRIFPVRRGIFEDKVASFWCVLHYSSLYKVNTVLERPTQVLLTTKTTLAACVPSLLLLFRSPSK